MLRIGIWFAALIAPCLAHAQARSAAYKFTVFKAPPGVSETLVAKNGMNTKLLERQSPSGKSACLLIQGRTETVISDPNGAFTKCNGLSGNNGVVGFYTGDAISAPYTGFAYINGVYADVVPPGAVADWGSAVNAISSNGLMAGTYLAADLSYPVFLTYGPAYNEVQVDGVNILAATGVNDQGVVVAQEVFATMRGPAISSVLILDGVAFGIIFPGAATTFATGINNKGDVVGYYLDQTSVQHGFIYRSATNKYFGPIDPPGSTSTTLTSIADNGVITGATIPTGATTANAILGIPIPPK